MATIDISMIVKAVNDASYNLRQVRDDVHGIGVSAEETSNRLRAINVVMAGIVVNKAVQLGKAFLETASDIENMRTRLVLAIGTLKEADAVIDHISKTFEGTRVSTEAVTEAVIELTQAGLDVGKAQDFADAIGKLSLLGKDSPQAISAIGEAFTKLLARPEIDMRSLIGVVQKDMPIALGIMAKEAGKTTNQFIADVQSGSYQVMQIIDLLTKGVGNNLNSLLLQQRNTISGSFAFLKNAWRDSIQSLEDTNIGSNIARRMRDIRVMIDEWIDSLKKLDPEIINRFFAAIDNGAIVAGKLASVLAPLAAGLALIAEATLKLLASVPTEALGAGLLAYLFIGRTGGVVVAAAVAAAVTQFGSLKAGAQDVINLVEKYLPVGIIALLIWGPAGAAAAIAASASVDYLLSKMLDLRSAVNKATGVSGERSNTWDRWREAGATAFDGLRVKAELFYGSLDKNQQQAKDNQQRYLDQIYGPFEQNITAQVDGYKRAAAARDEFIRGVAQSAGSDTTPPFIKNAVEGVDRLKSALIEVKGQGAFDALRVQAQEYDAAVVRANNSTVQQSISLEQIAQKTKTLAAQRGGFTSQQQEEYNATVRTLQAQADALKASYDKINSTLSGNTLGASLADINKGHAEWLKQLEEIKKSTQDAVTKYANQGNMAQPFRDSLAQINKLIADGNTQLGEQETRATSLDEILQRRLSLEQQSAQLRIQQQSLELKKDFSNDPLRNVLQGTSAGALITQNLQQQVQLKQQMVNIDTQIANLEQQRFGANEALKTQIDETIGKYRALKSETASALSNLSAEAGAAKQLWQSVGQTIENGVVNGVTGLITRTMTLQQVGQQMFQALTQAAVKYLFQLLLIKSASAFAGAGGGLGGGGLISKLFAADGAVVPGNVRMFANGGIISGPTLFGMAGEAGTEAIMPLERVGGKLGVRTIGDGGSATHVHIHAIDTQTGVKFLMDNMDTIHGLMSQRNKLNRGMRQIP